jgi:hypothetical protein
MQGRPIYTQRLAYQHRFNLTTIDDTIATMSTGLLPVCGLLEVLYSSCSL